jgi:hypothetical protein
MAQTHIVHYVGSLESVSSPVSGDYYALPNGDIFMFRDGAGFTSGGEMGGIFSFFRKIGNALGNVFTLQNPFPRDRDFSYLDRSGLID